MKWLAIVLLLGVFIAHDGAYWLADHSRYSAAAVFYMLQGIWGAVLAGCLLVLISAAKESIWKSLCIVALIVAIVEGLQMPVCRLMVDDINLKPAGVSLCDYVTGLPIGAAIVCLEVFAIAWLIGSYLRR